MRFRGGNFSVGCQPIPDRRRFPWLGHTSASGTSLSVGVRCVPFGGHACAATAHKQEDRRIAERLIAYDGNAVYLEAPVNSGGPNTPTPVGVYSVLAKRTNWTMKSPWPKPDPRWYPDSWINYSLLFESSGYFMHDANWRSVYGPGSNLLRTVGTGWLGTHGCVNVPLKTEAALYFWAPIGTPVIVQL